MKRGRKPRIGERYPSGKLKPYQADVSPTLVQRMRDMARSGAADANLGTPLGWLYLHMEITHPQMAAGLEYARLRARYDRAIDAPSRTCASPSYGAAFGAETAADLTEEDRTAAAQHAKRENSAVWSALDRSSAAIALLDKVCIENEHPNWSERRALLPLLSTLAAHFRLTNR